MNPEDWSDGPLDHMRLYLVTDGVYTKVGIARNVAARMQALRNSSPQPLVLDTEWHLRFPARILEKALHNYLREHGYHTHREWFQVTPEEIREVVLPRIKDEIMEQIQEIRKIRSELCRS